MDNSFNSLVSIIIPVYHVRPYIFKCLESVSHQSYKKLEIIVIDSSEDGEEEIIRSFCQKDERFIHIRQEPKGLGLARDKGMDCSSGEWICFLDGDDYIHEKHIEFLMKAAIENNCLMSRCYFVEVMEDEDVVMEDLPYTSPKLFSLSDYFIYLFRKASKGISPFGVWGAVYHNSIMEKLRFGNLRFAEDSYLSPHIAYAASKRPIAVIEAPLYYYVQRKGSLLHERPNLNRLDRYYAKKSTMEFWKKLNNDDMYDLFYPDFFSCMVNDYLDLCVYCNDAYDKFSFLKKEIEREYEAARRMSLQVIRMNPGGKEKWEEITSEDMEFIQYGYGKLGKKIYPILKHCGIKVTEIWDKESTDTNLDIPVVKPKNEISNKQGAIVMVANTVTSIEIFRNLREIGFNTIYNAIFIQDAVRYRLLSKYLPIVLDSYI